MDHFTGTKQQRAGNKAPGVIRGRVVYLLALVILVQTIYPITADNSPLGLIVYQILYGCLLFAGILVASDTPFYTRLLIFLGIAWMVTALVYTFNLKALWAQLASYIVLVAFQTMVINVLLQFVFRARVVNRDVIYAAVAVYFLLGALFVPIYGLIETYYFTGTGMNAFSDAQVDPTQPFPWQNLVYYSYATLTTMGYGDVLPLTPWARSMASLEAIIGVLYVTIIMARLVGLYAADESEEQSKPE